ncbi:bactofilin family protein [Pyrinomonas methylaliphatogenes]|jgi:cytoskeletal protein CcmA (bactofilin family)|uniref:Integral membrane protein CcmA involved in cell shape determination n=1 Tax=Pyrinomonas methylaliphatogenes TaxID=454194 RepID=A0A0B6WV04_9BACT|nr:polymer-forming cytoskeletal protein [Pyrinomonas methylaliphatogenes]CDM64074.1 Integral membrane protein CcmA involved in cell shape determination [Pyrinomonas methylaliphatogenes]
MFRVNKNPKEEQAVNEGPTNQTASPATTAFSAPSASVAATPSSASRAVTESEALARDIKDGKLSGFVGAGTMLKGEATFKALLRVDGHLSGRISSPDGTLIVSTGGQVDADIEVAVAIINGTVNGDIIASKRIEMGRAAKVTGNIQTPALVVENGAIFEGSCRMLQLKEAQDKRREEEKHSTYAESAEPASAVTDYSDVTS